MHSKLKIISLTIFFILTSFCLEIKAQEPNVCLTLHSAKDSLFISVINKQEGDTVFFSLYKQIQIKGKWITSVYDLFADPANPKTSILAVYPGDSFSLPLKLSDAVYSDQQLPLERSNCTRCLRIMMVADFARRGKMRYTYFSETF